MPYNGSGVFSAPGASFPAVTGTVIDSAKYNAVVNDVATGLTTAITKDGQTTITANLPMATYRHTGVGDATALTDYASANQVIDNTLTYGGASAAGTDTYAVSLPISPGAYVAGNRYSFLTDVANTGACTINFNGLGAKSIKMADGGDPASGAIQATAPVDVIYDGTNFVLLNPWRDSDTTETLTNKTIGDNNIIDAQSDAFSIQKSTDSAVDVVADLSTATAGTMTLKFDHNNNFTVTFPSTTTTLVGDDHTQNLSNKTLLNPVVADTTTTTKTVDFDLVGATASTATTLDFNQTANRTLTFPDATANVAVSSGTTGGTGSAGAGNQYIEINIAGTVYKILHDGTV